MEDLIKRLFWPKKDYIRVVYGYNENFVNEFLSELNNRGGKVVKLDDVSTTAMNSKVIETEYRSGKFVTGMDSSLQEKLVIHYRCFEKINYLSEKEKMELEWAEKQRIKNFKVRSKVLTCNLRKQYTPELEEQKQKINPNSIPNSSYVPPGEKDDLPF